HAFLPFFFSLTPPPPRSTLFPYTTLFRSIDRTKYAPAAGLHKGAYVLADAPHGKPELILMATGSEVSLCLGVYEQLSAEGRRVRDRKSTRLNSSHVSISYAVFCLKKKKKE